MKTYGGVDIWIRIFFTSALFAVECPASRPLPLYPRGRNPRYPIVMEAGWAIGPVWITWRIEKSHSYWGWYSDPLAVQLIVQPLYRLRCLPLYGIYELKFKIIKLYLFPSIGLRSLKGTRRQNFVHENV
jgi:hypothetical protein